MLNWIWLGLVLAGALVAGFTGNIQPAVDGAFSSVAKAVELAIGLVGVMTLWLGLMRLAEVSGLVQGVARLLRPLLIWLFPDVPSQHPAMGAMVLNLAANALGLTNAATPLGLRAMRDLETLNRNPGTATDAMCTFLALNTGSVQLLPISAIAVLAAAGSRQPTAIIGTTLIATACSSIAGLVVIKLLARLPLFRIRSQDMPEARAGHSLPGQSLTCRSLQTSRTAGPPVGLGSPCWLASDGLRGEWRRTHPRPRELPRSLAGCAG